MNTNNNDMKDKLIEVLKENKEWESSLDYIADQLLILFGDSKRETFSELINGSALPNLFDFSIKTLNDIAESCKRMTSGNVSHNSKAIEGKAKRGVEFINKHYR